MSSWKKVSEILHIDNSLAHNLFFLEGYYASSNCYVVKGDGIAIIDPANDYTAFIELFELGFRPTEVKTAILTHGHFDHSMGIFELMRYGGIRESGMDVILHEAGPDMLKEEAKKLGCRIIEVRDGDTIDLWSFKFKIIHSPGHTMDSICIYHEPTGIMFTGDTVLPHAVASPDPIAGGSVNSYLLTLRKLLKEDIRVLMPGHGYPVKDGRKTVERTYQAFIESLIGPITDWKTAATELMKRGYLEETIFSCDKGLALNPYDTYLRKLKAICLTELSRIDEALLLLDEILKHEKDPMMLIVKGRALMQMERYDESIKMFDEALEIDQKLREAAIYKGIALALSGRMNEALNIPEFNSEFSKRLIEDIKGRIKELSSLKASS